MIDIGQLLRQQREAQELSLADVEAQTRIRRRYLEAIESGDWDELPNDVVARGFLRTYARYLGLDADELLAESSSDQPKPAAVAETSVAAELAADPNYKPIDLDLYADPTGDAHRTRRIVRLLALILVIALLLVLLVRIGLPYLQELTAPDAAPASTVTLPAPGAQPTTPLIAVAGETPAPTATPASAADAASATPSPQPTRPTTATTLPSPTPTATPAGQIVLRLTVGQRSWVRLTVDEQVIIEGILTSGFAETYTADRTIDLLTGNAAGVSVTVNGQTQSPLGEAGQIVRLVWNIDDGVVIPATAAPPVATAAAGDSAPTQTVVPAATPTPGS